VKRKDKRLYLREVIFNYSKYNNYYFHMLLNMLSTFMGDKQYIERRVLARL
jgi:hypothetical protein